MTQIPALSLPSARLASRTGFTALGVLSGVWGVHIPGLKLQWGFSEAELSGLLLAVAVGALAALAVAGRWVGRFGARRMTQWAAASAALALASVLWWSSVPQLVVALALYGASMGVYDVAVNTGGMALEEASGVPILGQLHGLFSVGAMGGAALAAGLLRTTWPEGLQMGVLTLGAAAAVAVASRGTLQARHVAAAPGAAHFVWPRGRLLLIGALVMVSFMAEGVMCDWSVLFLRQELAQPEALAGLGYALFAGAMAGARFGTDALRARFGEGSLLRTGGGLCALAMALALAVSLGRSLPALAYLGIALVGVGLAPSVPILLKAATRVPGASSAAALSSVSSVGYLGFLLGPSLIGALSKAFSLTSALGVVVLAGLLLALVPLALESRAEAGE